MKKNVWIILCSMFMLCNAFAQQEIQLSQATQHPIFFNPAYAGAEKQINLNAIYRWQWVNLEGAPQSQYLTAHLPIDYLKSGVGININNDIIGAYRFTKAKLSYAYKLELTKYSTLSFGINAGINQINISGEKLLTTDGTYENLINHNDPFLPNNAVNSIVPNLGIGVFYKSEQFQAGFSANSLVGQTVNLNANNAVGQFTVAPQYSLQMNYLIDISNNIQLKPSLLVHSDIKILQMQSHLFVNFGEKFAVGLGYRGFSSFSNDAIIITGQVKLYENLMATYSYDIVTSNLNSTNIGTHELGIAYRLFDLIPSPKSKVIYNPRFL